MSTLPTEHMYCELFGLAEAPFQLTPDPQFLFASKQHARARAYMESTIWLADGFVVLTGDIGSGKTTLIESFLDGVPEGVVVAHISQTQLSPVEFLQAVLVEFGFSPFKKRKIELLSMLKNFLVEQYSQNNKVLLIVDEAQNLSRKVLEEIRLLSGIESQKEKVLRIILAGQPELGYKLDSPRLEQLNQRVRLRFHLSSLSNRETQEYVEHRLRVAGSQGRQIFTEEALEQVFRYSGGVPRLINILCDTAMLCAFADEKDVVEADVVNSAVEELQWVEYSERVHNKGRDAESTGEYTADGGDTLAKLEVLCRERFVNDYDLRPGRTIIGRTTDNDLQIRSKFVSRHHVQIVSDRQQSTLEDLNSTNGVFVDSKKVKRHRLADGDVIQLGEHRLIYRDLRSAGEPEEEPEDEPDDEELDEEFHDETGEPAQAQLEETDSGDGEQEEAEQLQEQS
jgi:general secretion pathway protein A